jgi:hypothetical protein
MDKKRIRKPTPYQRRNGTAGVGVDYAGAPVVDPTANVIALSEAATQRQDDLRELSEEKLDAEIRRIDAEARHIAEIASLRADFQEKLAIAESKRIDAIRTVDVGAVAIASERAAQQATVLATQVAQSAETLRTLVATTATSFAAQQAQLQNALMERITALEKSSYVGVGRSGMTDPMLTELTAGIQSLRESRDRERGVKTGVTAGAQTYMTLVSLVFSFIAAAAIIIHVVK